MLALLSSAKQKLISTKLETFCGLHSFHFVGVGIVLITVSGIAWRLTATDAPSCRAMLGLGGGCEEDYNNGRFLSRPQVTTNNSYCNASSGAAGANGGANRPQHPYAGNFTHRKQSLGNSDGLNRFSESAILQR